MTAPLRSTASPYALNYASHIARRTDAVGGSDRQQGFRRMKKPTLEMVAAHAGVSRATVSRVVNGTPTVEPTIVAKVQRSIEELNYVPNRAARSLASNRAGAIALVVPESADKVFSDPFFGSVIKGIASVLDETDFTLTMIIESATNVGKHRRYMTDGNVDGALILSHHVGDRSYADLVEALPVVFGGRPVEEPPGATSVDVDNLAAAELAVSHLLGCGRRRIATIAGPQSMRPGIDRLEGWRNALDRAGLQPGPVAFGDFTTVSGITAARELLASGEPFDAVFAANDQMALGAYPVLGEAGLRIPDDVAVLGFDDSPFSADARPPLTTIRQPMHEFGAEMVRRLIALIEHRAEPTLTVLPATLVERDSV